MKKTCFLALGCAVLFTIAGCGKSGTSKKVDNAKMIIGKWVKIGSECDKTGVKCKKVKGKTPLIYSDKGTVAFGRLSQPYSVEGDMLYIGKKRSEYGIVELNEKIFIWHAKKRNEVEKFQKL